MELSARDKRILAEIECGSELEDPKWVRRLERLSALRRARRGLGRKAALAALVLAWAAAVVLGATIAPRPLLWTMLAAGAFFGVLGAVLRRRQGPRRSRRRIARVPRQNGRAAEGGDELI